MRSLDEYLKTRTPTTRPPVDLTKLQVMVQEGVRVEALTKDENWDYFLRYLEGAIKFAERMRDAELVKLRDPALVNDDAVRACRAVVARLDTRIDVLKEILMVPRLLQERGHLAKTQLDDLAQGA